MTFLKIDKIVNKDKLIQDYIKTRNIIKENYENQKIADEIFEERKTKDDNNNQKIFNSLISLDNKHVKLLDEIKLIKQPKLIPYSPSPYRQPVIEAIKPTPTENPDYIKVSNLISAYLSETKDRSHANYSIKYHTDKHRFYIGDTFIHFSGNSIKVRERTYEATNGLMELLTKSNPDTNKIIEEDYDNYKQILVDTKAIYDKNNRLIGHNNSSKYKILKEKLFPTLFFKNQTNTGSSLIIIPSDPNQLIEQLKLSLASYDSGNNGEFNRISSILDSTLKLKLIDLKIYKNIMKTL